MRKLRPFEYFKPETLDEALEILGHYGEAARILAGGTDLLVSLKHQKGPSPDAVVDLKGINSLNHFTWTDGGGFRAGALFTIAAVTRHIEIHERLEMLRTAALAIGHPQVRSRATVVGNLCNGSPAADMAPSLLALDARVKIARAGGERIVPLSDFYEGPFKTVVNPGEIVIEIEAPARSARTAGHCAWFPKINAVDETLVGAAAVVALEDASVIRSARIALGSMAPIPMRAHRAEEFLRGQKIEPALVREAARIAVSETSPRRRAQYREQMAVVLLQRSLNQAVQLAG